MPEIQSYFDFSDYLSVSEAARVLGVTRAWVHQLGEREIDYIQTPLGRLYSRSALSIWGLERDISFTRNASKRHFLRQRGPRGRRCSDGVNARELEEAKNAYEEAKATAQEYTRGEVSEVGSCEVEGI